MYVFKAGSIDRVEASFYQFCIYGPYIMGHVSREATSIILLVFDYHNSLF